MRFVSKTFTDGVEVESTEQIVAGIGADRFTLASDNTDAVTLNYASADNVPHEWNVNGATATEAPTLDKETGLWCSEIEVTAAQPGPIDITCNGVAPLFPVTAV